MNPIKILIVEDETAIALDLRAALTGMGYQVPAMVATGEEALETIMEIDFDLILMDIMLSGDMDGIEAAGRIHGEARTPIIFLTAHSDDERLNRAKIAGPYGYLLKPFRMENLHANIEMALSRAEKDRALRESEERFRQVFANCPDPIYLAREGRTVLANPAAGGYRAMPAARGPVGPAPCLWEEDILDARGNPCVLELSAAAADFCDGPAVLMVGRDITRRKGELWVREEEIRRERRYSAVLKRRGVDHRLGVASFLDAKVEQPLFTARWQMDLIRQECPDGASGRIDKVADAIHGIISELDAMMSQMKAPVLHALGLGAAIADLAMETSRNTGLDIAFVDETKNSRIFPYAKELLFRTTKTLMMKFIRSAPGAAQRIRMTRVDREIRIELIILDPGAGSAPEFEEAPEPGAVREPGSGYGRGAGNHLKAKTTRSGHFYGSDRELVGIAEELSLAGGGLEETRAPGAVGVRLIISMPED